MKKILKTIKDYMREKIEIFKDFNEFYKYGVIGDLDFNKEVNKINYKNGQGVKDYER